MKKKTTMIFLAACMVFTIIGIALMAVFYFDVIKAFSLDKKAVSIYVGIFALLVCWTALFVVFLRQTSESGEYGKKDALTGIGNRNYLEAKYKRIGIRYNQQLSVVYIAFNSDKLMQRYNKVVSEKIQKGAAKLLLENCTENDYVARIDDCTFGMILPCCDALHAEQRVINLVNKLNKYQHYVLFENIAPFRSGIFVNETEKSSFDNAMDSAKIAYEFSCDEGVNTYVYYDALASKSKLKNNLQKKLTNAIDNGEFELFLQFVYNVKEKKFVGAEALSRWNSPDDGFVMPAYYINDMHNCGVIKKFDMYMFEKTCALLEEWSKKNDFKDLLVSCNITRVTISAKDFLESIKKIAKKYKFDRNRLILEITEDALIGDQTVAYKNIVGLRDEGFKVALDDFGAGSSSFSDINNYPVDQIKVDRQFVSKCTTSRGTALLQGIVDLAHALKIGVVCEGVETKAQLDAVNDAGTDYIQGYYYSYVFSVEEACEHYMKSLKLKTNEKI